MNLSGCTIAVIGLGYVGLPLAVEFGKKRKVIGFDIKADRIAELQRGQDHTLEVSAQELREAKHLSFTADAAELRADDSVIFIVTVPTPVDKANRPDLTPLIKASETVGRLLKPNDVVIYESTVYPGCTEEVCVPILERESGLKYAAGDDQDGGETTNGFYVGYSPERINPGDKTHRLPDIKKVTSGSTPEAAQAINALYQEIVTAGTHLASSIKVAEAAKVIENAQRDLNIAFVNELSLIFNQMRIDTTEVLTAAGTKWNFLPFKPGLVGGHCIGVDPYYLTFKAQELGYQPEVILSGRRINEGMGRHAALTVIQMMIKNRIPLFDATVGILGVTFKEDCPDIRNSKTFDIINELKTWGVNVKIIDSWADPAETHQQYGIHLSNIATECAMNSLIVAVAHSDFKKLRPKDLKRLCSGEKKPVIADLKSIFNKTLLEEEGFEVFRF